MPDAWYDLAQQRLIVLQYKNDCSYISQFFSKVSAQSSFPEFAIRFRPNIKWNNKPY